MKEEPEELIKPHFCLFKETEITSNIFVMQQNNSKYCDKMTGEFGNIFIL